MADNFFANLNWKKFKDGISSKVVSKEDEKFFAKLEVKNGDTLLLHGPFTEEELTSIANAFASRGLENVMLIVLGDDPHKTIVNLPDSVMERHGWKRVNNNG